MNNIALDAQPRYHKQFLRVWNNSVGPNGIQPDGFPTGLDIAGPDEQSPPVVLYLHHNLVDDLQRRLDLALHENGVLKDLLQKRLGEAA
jgi:hypothetical protein